MALLLAAALPAAANAGSDKDVSRYPDDPARAFDVPAANWAPANSQDGAAKESAAFLGAALRHSAANEWCRLAFSDLNLYKPLGSQKRDDLQGSEVLNRAEWEHKTQLDARARDYDLVAAWQYPRTVRGPQ